MKLFIFLLALPLAAAEEQAGHGSGQQDMTPWLWANFFILMGALVYLSMKYGGPLLAAKKAAISQGLTEAETAKAEADRRVAEVNARLAGLDTEIENLKSKMREEQAREGERIAARNVAEIARVQQQAEQEIESLAKAARLDLQQHAGQLALGLAEQKIRARMNPDQQRTLTREFIGSLS